MLSKWLSQDDQVYTSQLGLTVFVLSAGVLSAHLSSHVNGEPNLSADRNELRPIRLLHRRVQEVVVFGVSEYFRLCGEIGN